MICMWILEANFTVSAIDLEGNRISCEHAIVIHSNIAFISHIRLKACKSDPAKLPKS